MWMIKTMISNHMLNQMKQFQKTIMKISYIRISKIKTLKIIGMSKLRIFLKGKKEVANTTYRDLMNLL